MGKIRKVKMLLSVLLFTFCVMSVASVNSHTKESITVNNTSLENDFYYNPPRVVVKVGQRVPASAVIPLGYGNLTFEDNPYCRITVSGSNIMIEGVQSTGNGDTTVIGTVTQVPIYARNYFSLTASLIVKVYN